MSQPTPGIGDSLLWSGEIPGIPAVLKNSKMLVPRHTKSGKTVHLPISSKAARLWKAVAQKALQKIRPADPINCPVRMLVLIYGPWNDQYSMPDLSNLLQGPEDALQEAGILADDALIRSHDGSRAIPLCLHCPCRGIIARGPRAGQKKDSCGHKKACQFARISICLFTFDDTRLDAMAAAAVGLVVL